MRKKFITLKKKLVSFIRLKEKKLNICDQDIFLVSYPRSGNTWVRFLLANLMKSEGESIDFHNVHEYVPEIGRNNDLIKEMPSPRIIKSHTPKRNYPRVIYLVRDGRDVYVSYFHYRLNQLPDGYTFQKFLRREDHFPCLWSDHVKSWLYSDEKNLDLIKIYYEDLLQNTAMELKKIVDFTGINTFEARIKEAVNASNIDRMREIDQKKGRKYNLTDTKNFIRKGVHGDWHTYFTDSDKDYFKKRAGELLIQLGYEDDYDW